MDFVIVEVPVLSGVEDPNRWGVLADQALWRAESIAIYGNDDLASTEKESVAYAVPYASLASRGSPSRSPAKHKSCSNTWSASA